MHPEKVGFEDCDFNSIFKVIDKETQTNQANNVQSSASSVKSFKLPLPRELEKPDEGQIKVFSFCQIIQDPECPKAVTIVRESVTEEVHKHPTESPHEEAYSNRYRYCKEVIKPYLRDYPPDCPDSGELLLRDAIITANEEFPEYPPCIEVKPDSDKKPANSTKQEGGEGKFVPPLKSEKKSDQDKKPKKSDKDTPSKKSSKESPPKGSDKDTPRKPSNKDLPPKKPCKQVPSKKSSKESGKEVTSKKSSKELPRKKSSKESPSKKSSKESTASESGQKSPKKKSGKYIPTKSDKDFTDKPDKSRKNSEPEKKERRHLVLCPNQKEPKICIQITDLNLCPPETESEYQEDSEGSGSKRKRKRSKEEGERSEKPKKRSSKRDSEYYQDREDSDCKRRREDEHSEKPKKRPGGRKSEYKSDREEDFDTKYREEDTSSKPKKGPCKGRPRSDQEDTDSRREEDEDRVERPKKQSYGKKPVYYQDRDSEARPDEEDRRSSKPRKRSVSRKAEPIPRSEDYGYKDLGEKSYSGEKSINPCQVLPPRPPKEEPPQEKPPRDSYPRDKPPKTAYLPPKKPKDSRDRREKPPKDKRREKDEEEDCKEDQPPPESCSDDDDEEECFCEEPPPPKSGKEGKDEPPPPKSGKEATVPGQENKPSKSEKKPKSRWPKNTEVKAHSDTKDSPPKPPVSRDCLGKILDTLKFKSVSESCKRRPLPKDMEEDCPSESSEKPRKNSSAVNGIPVHQCMKESESDKKVCKRKPSKNDLEKCVRKVKEMKSCDCEDKLVPGQVRQQATKTAPPPQPEKCNPDGSKVKSAMDAHNETLATLKCAMEDFMCKVFRSTQDAVTVITTESARQLEKLRKSASKSDCPPPKKVSDTRSSRENLRRFSIVNVDNPPTEKALPACENPPDPRANSPLYFIDKLVEKVDSAMSVISESIAFEVPKPVRPKTFNDVSSKYDIPKPTRPMPEDVANIIDPPGPSNNMLTSIKDKIWSIFCDDEKQDEESKQSSSVSSVSESDEDLINKMID